MIIYVYICRMHMNIRINNHSATQHNITYNNVTWHWHNTEPHTITYAHCYMTGCTTCCTLQNRTWQNITLHYITSHDITLHHITSHYITLYHITSQYITLHHVTLRCTHTHPIQIALNFKNLILNLYCFYPYPVAAQ